MASFYQPRDTRTGAGRTTATTSTTTRSCRDDVFSPTFTSDATSPSYPYIITADEKILKSRLSTSTFGSVSEEHESRGASSKLRLYFSPLKNYEQGSKTSSSTTTPSSSPPPPSSPPSYKTPASVTGSRSPTYTWLLRCHGDWI